MRQVFVRYSSHLKKYARMLRKNSTCSEVLLWRELKGKRMHGYDFHRQKPIGDYIVDFYCPALRLAIEIDGDSHAGKDADDIRRQRGLETLGVCFLRFDDIDVKLNMGGVLQVIDQWIVRHEGTHPVTPLAALASCHPSHRGE